MPPTPGSRLDRYELLSTLGAGGMGEVYLARDTKLDRVVALKLLPSALTADADSMRRFIREAKAASALNHPNILTVHEVGESGEQPFIATEFIEGTTLGHRIGSGRLSLGAALDVAIQVASALTAAHAVGLVHRDIKPANIMVRPDGVVKVVDFGLAKLMKQAGPGDSDVTAVSDGATAAGVVLGTISYMSPEQARGTTVDARSDIFSLGVVLYEMVTGSPPFGGSTPLETAAAILNSDPVPLERHVPDAPQDLRRIVAKALRKDREGRYQSIRDLLIDLKDLKADLDFAARLEHSTKPAGPVIRRAFGGHRRAVLASAAAIVVALMAFFSYADRAAPLSEKDTILIADFVNRTGEPVFDGTLKQGLAVQLSQSPFLNILPETRVQETLRLMGRSPDEAITKELGREICQRQGLKALVTGSVAKFDRTYSIALEAMTSACRRSPQAVSAEHHRQCPVAADDSGGDRGRG
jgi:serine/threonine protein kinase